MNDSYSWITWFLSTRSKSSWWQKRSDLRICHPPLFPLSRLCWWPRRPQTLASMWCPSLSCSRCMGYRATTPPSRTSPFMLARPPAPWQVLVNTITAWKGHAYHAFSKFLFSTLMFVKTGNRQGYNKHEKVSMLNKSGLIKSKDETVYIC